MSIRLTRLHAEYQKILALFTDNPYIKISKVVGNPPEEYEIEYNIKGLDQGMMQDKSYIKVINKHIVEIKIPRNYPVEQPVCRMLTTIFHPNIDSNTICIADPGQWTPGESLNSLIVRIGQIIAYQSYNIKSPRNGEAAKWADKNKDKLPIDKTDLSSILYSNVERNGLEIELQQQPKNITEEPPAENTRTEVQPFGYAAKEKDDITKESCDNCRTNNVELLSCKNGHLVCSDCSMICEKCHRTICVLCDIKKCAICGKVCCTECLNDCPSCSQIVCDNHFFTCNKCNSKHCSNCMYTCPECQHMFCKEHYDIERKLCKDCVSNINSKNMPDNKSHKMFCMNCGAKIENENANYCMYCGNKIF